MKNKINWNVSDADRAIIILITHRFLKTYPNARDVRFMMDITACHANGCPLRLSDFLNADDFNFFHDAHEICLNIDRETGQLRNGFLPRFSANSKIEA